jgi:hypothetical protein
MNDSSGQMMHIPIDRLEITQVIALEWQDGPIHGFVRFLVPATCWRFQLVAERFESETIDNRLYLLSEVSLVLWEELVDSLARPTEQNHPVWAPDWCFDTEHERTAADAIVGRLTDAASRGAEVLMRSSDMTRVDELWRLHGRAITAM